MALLQIGQVFQILTPQKIIPGSGRGETFDVTSYGADDNEQVDCDDIAEALWVVTGAAMDGGGTCHGPGDVYPDGWGVKAVRVTPDGEPIGQSIFFRQSGCFNNMLEEKDVRVVGMVKGTRYNLALTV